MTTSCDIQMYMMVSALPQMIEDSNQIREGCVILMIADLWKRSHWKYHDGGDFLFFSSMIARTEVQEEWRLTFLNDFLSSDFIAVAYVIAVVPVLKA